MSVLTLFLYAVGTVQDFIDSTQFALIRLYVVLGIFLAATSSCGMLLNLGRLIKRKTIVYLFRALGYILLALFAVFTVLTALFILTMAEGNISSLIPCGGEQRVLENARRIRYGA